MAAALAVSRPFSWHVTRWRNIFVAVNHNTWIFSLAMMLLLSHRNIVGAMVLMGGASLFQPGLWPSFACLFRAETIRARSGGAVLLALLGFCAWTFVSVLWVPAKEEAEWAAQMLLFILFAAAVLWTARHLPLAHIRLVSASLMGASLLGIYALGVEGVTGGLLRDIIPPDSRPDKDIIAAARGVSIGICFLPGILFLIRVHLHRWRALAFGLGLGAVAALGAGALLLSVSSNVLALVAALAAGGIALVKPRLALRTTIALFAVSLILAPFLALALPPLDDITRMEGGPTSWIQRLGIWRFTAEHIFSSPQSFLIGGGVNFGQVLSDAETMITLPGYPIAIPVMPSHPHNAFLQVWLEFGAVGAGLLLLALYAAWHWAGQVGPGGDADRQRIAFVAAALVAIGAASFMYAAIEMSLWTPWRLAAPAFGFYALIAANRCFVRGAS